MSLKPKSVKPVSLETAKTKYWTRVNIDNLIGLREAGQLVGKSHVTIWRWIHEGDLVGVKVGDHIFVDRGRTQGVAQRKERLYRFGHAPGHLREAFCDLFEDWMGGRSFDAEKALALCGQLWNCSDVVGSEMSNAAEDLWAGEDDPLWHHRCTYGAFARQLAQRIRDEADAQKRAKR